MLKSYQTIFIVILNVDKSENEIMLSLRVNVRSVPYVEES